MFINIGVLEKLRTLNFTFDLVQYFCTMIKSALVPIFLMVMLAMCVGTNPLTAQTVTYTTAQYISLYKDIAIEEMKLYNIPASITLAQGILESDNGNSVLARNTNNHFGIKCKAEWTGGKYYHDDDEAQECFRKYPSVRESYRDHSLFLTTRKHYGTLFTLQITDYRGWARGLKAAGYATNPAYADLLINIIETNKLHAFDLGKDTVVVLLARDSVQSVVILEPEIIQPAINDTIPRAHDDQEEFQEVILTEGNRVAGVNNGVHYISAKRGDTYEKIASDMGLIIKDLYRYNDVEKEYKPQAGEQVYIELKKEDAAQAFHTVAAGETMHSISQLYGLRLKSLYAKNRMKVGTAAETGQRLWLQDSAPIY
jgi:LysM repeat protein